MVTGATKAEASSDGCPTSQLFIPNLSGDGMTSLPIPTSTEAFISHHCGSVLGIDDTDVSLALVCKLSCQIHQNIYLIFVAATRPFVIGVFTDDATALTAPTTGFSLDYTQVYNILVYAGCITHYHFQLPC